MAAKVKDETVKSPGTLVISGYVGSPDITKTVTPDIKHPGHSRLILIDLAPGRSRLGTNTVFLGSRTA
jgi:phosphoribosylformylglycinamidine synthase